MSAWDSDDLDAMFDADMPGYALATVDGSEVAGLFRAARAVALGDGGVEHNPPSFRCAESGIATLDRGETLVIASTTYRAVEIQRSDRGHALVVLEAT